MSRKYYADIDLYFDDMKYSIVGDEGLKKQELIELVEDFAKDFNLECDKKQKKFFDKEGKEVGSYTVAAKTY